MLPKIPFPSLLNALLDEKGRGQGNEFVLLRSLKPGVPKMSIIQKKEKEKKMSIMVSVISISLSKRNCPTLVPTMFN